MILKATAKGLVSRARLAAQALGLPLFDVLWNVPAEHVAAVLLDQAMFCEGAPGGAYDDPMPGVPFSAKRPWTARELQLAEEARQKLRELTPEDVARLKAQHEKAKANMTGRPNA